MFFFRFFFRACRVIAAGRAAPPAEPSGPHPCLAAGAPTYFLFFFRFFFRACRSAFRFLLRASRSFSVSIWMGSGA